MKAKDKKRIAGGIALSFVLSVIGAVLIFHFEYYVNPSHPWMMVNGVLNEANR